MKPIKQTAISLIFLMGFFMGLSQEKEKTPTSSPAMGATSKTTNKRLASTVEPDRKFSYEERELDYLSHIWEGEYDNVEQLDFDKMRAKENAKGKPHERVHVSVRQFQNSNFGVGSVYIEEYRNNDPAQLTRQCIYQLIPDDTEKAIRVMVFHFKNRTPILAAGKSLESVSALTPVSEELIEGCPLILRREGAGFLAETVDKKCVKSPKNNQQTIDYQFRVSEEGFTFQEILYAADMRLADTQQTSAYTLEKARCFSCMIDFPNDTNGRPTVTNYYIDILDQGGSFKFTYPDGRNMTFGMRNTWSFGMHRETFVIYLVDDVTKKTLIYSWGSPGADRIGFNPGWIRAQCDLKTARNVKLQRELRPGS